MPTINLNYTNAQANGLQFALKKVNAEIAAQNAQRAAQVPPLDPLPTLTAAQYAQRVWDATLDSYVAQASVEDKTTLAEAWASASQATRDQVKALLGVS